MKIRGQRECRSCGTRWSYYETGEIECPNCNSLRSRGIDERTEHTSAPATLNLSPAWSLIETEGLAAALDTAIDQCRTFITQTGFIRAGELEPLSETYLAATELMYAAREATRFTQIDDDEELYLLSLLRGAVEERRPDPDEVPASLHAARGLAYADAVGSYRRDLQTYLDDHPVSMAQPVLMRITQHMRRIEALDGEVEPSTADRLVLATQETSEYVRTGNEAVLEAARNRLDAIA